MYEFQQLIADPIVRIIIAVSVLAQIAILIALASAKNARNQKSVLQTGLMFIVAIPFFVVGLSSIGWELQVATLPRISQSLETEPKRIELGQIQDEAPAITEDSLNTPTSTTPVYTAINSSVEPTQTNGIRTTDSETTSGKTLRPEYTICDYLISIWATVTIISLLFVLISIFNLIRLIRRCRPIADTNLKNVIAKFNLPSSARYLNVMTSDDIPAPVAIGFAKCNTIVLPATLLNSLSLDQLEQVLIHEAEHIANGDTFFHILSRICRAIWWWNPLVLTLDNMLDRAREEVCDEAVLETVSPVDYGRTLLAVSQMSIHWRRPTVLVSLLGSRSKLEDRVKKLLAPKRTRLTPLSPLRIAFTTAIFGILTMFASAAQIGFQEFEQEVDFVQDEDQDEMTNQELTLIRRRLMSKQTVRIPVFILDSYLGLDPEQQAVVERLLLENWPRAINPSVVYNYFPSVVFNSIDNQEFRETLSASQQRMFDELPEKSFSLIDQINELSTQTREEWVNQPIEILRSGVIRRIDELDKVISLESGDRTAMMAAGQKAIRQIKEARGILYDRYSKIPDKVVLNEFALRLMMDGPFYQIGNSNSWQQALIERFSKTELAALKKNDQSRFDLLKNTVICNVKYDGHLNMLFTEAEHETLDQILSKAFDDVAEDGNKNTSHYSFLEMYRRLRLQEAPQLKELLGQEKWDRLVESLEKSANTSQWNIPLTKETSKQFDDSQKPPQATNYRQLEVVMVDQDDNPIADLEIRYVGFHLQEDGLRSFRLNRAYGLKPVKTNSQGICQLRFPADEPVKKITVTTQDRRFENGGIDIPVEGEENQRITATRKQPTPTSFR